MKRIISFALALVMVLALAACGGSGSSSSSSSSGSTGSTNAGTSSNSGSTSTAKPYEGVKVGYCPPTLSDAWLALIAEKVGYYCEEAGMTFTATEGNASIETQIQQTENFIAMGCDVIIVQPTNLDAMQSTVEKARAEGRKVVVWADDPTWDVEASFMSVDSVQGELCAEMAMMWADETFPDATDGSIKVAWLTTQYDDRPTAKMRQDAMVDNLDSRFEVVFRKDNLDTTVQVMDAMNECLALNPDINVVFCFSDAHAIGANSAIMADATLDHSKIAVFAGSATDEGKVLVDQSENNESVLRGLVTFGEGDQYFIDGAQCIMDVYDGKLELNTCLFCEHGTYNTVGHTSTFDPTEYSANYVQN